MKWKGEQRLSRWSVTTCKTVAACFSSTACRRRRSPVFGWTVLSLPRAALQRALSEGAAIGASRERCAPAPQSCFVKSIRAGDGVIPHRLACVSWHADVSKVAVLWDALEQRTVWWDVVRMEKETEKVGSGDWMGYFHPTAAGFRSDCSLWWSPSLSTCTNTNKSELQWLIYC